MLTRGLVLDVANQLGGAMPGVVTLHDWSRYQNDGVMTDITWAQTAAGLWAMEFDGATSFANCGNDESLNITHDFSIEFWVYLISYTTGAFVDKGFATNGFMVWVTAAPWLNIYTNNTNRINTPPPPLATWTHIVALITAASTNFYQNAVPGTPGVGGLPNGNNVDLYIGKDIVGNRVADCNMSPARIYNYALTPAQIRARYHSTRWLFGDSV